MFMRDTLEHPGTHSVEKFKARCISTPPLDYAYVRATIQSYFLGPQGFAQKSVSHSQKVVSLLERDATNPLVLAMEADELRTTETFNKWRTVIENVLSQFVSYVGKTKNQLGYCACPAISLLTILRNRKLPYDNVFSCCSSHI